MAVLVGQLVWAIPGTAGTTLLQALSAESGAADKVGTYSVFAVVGAVASIVGTLIGGALSDRTRSRIGRRSPWLLGSSLLSGLALTATGLVHGGVLIGAGYGLFQFGVGVWVASAAALIPDHVAPGSIGRASAYAGFGYLLGQTVGGVAGGIFVSATGAGLAIVPWTMVVGAVVITLTLKPADNRGVRQQPPSQLLRDFIPRGGADFWLAFAGRFFFIFAIVMLTTFQLFTLTDYLHLPAHAAGHVIAWTTLLFGVLAATTVVITGPLSDRTGRTKFFVVSASTLVAIALVPVLLSPTVLTYVIFFAITGIAFGAYIAVDQSLMIAVLRRRSTAARDLGFLSSAQTLPGVLAPVLGGMLAAHLGYAALFVTSLVAALLAAAVIVIIRSVR